MSDVLDIAEQLQKMINTTTDGGVIVTGMKAAEEISRLRAENEKLRAALKPFADASYRNLGPDDARIVGDCTLGDLRAAAAALKESNE